MGGTTALQMSCFVEMGSVKNLVLYSSRDCQHLSLERFALFQFQCFKKGGGGGVH